MSAWYNEIDPFAAQWLRELIKAGHIAPGIVDERSIEDVRPEELSEFTQCHFFAGIGVWSYALRRAGWPDDKPVWTGSCPCQPFSAAGKKGGFDDSRHLWPAFHWLIRQCMPAAIIGEQVASKATGPWFDLVQADLEELGYAFGCVPFPSAGVGAPHIRDRAYWVAHPDHQRLEGWSGMSERADQRTAGQNGLACGMADTEISTQRAFDRQSGSGIRQKEQTGGHRVSSGMGNSDSAPCQRDARSLRGEERKSASTRCENGRVGDGYSDAGDACRVADTNSSRSFSCTHTGIHCSKESAGARHGESERSGAVSNPGPLNGFWSDADWLFCRDGKWRPVEPGTFALVDGASNRVGRLRGYGNAINAEAAKVFIETCLSI